ncbi:unnamed protein product [marine sediment metagenome]|uniref:HD domain-containing protein n=1 Tax=marine sediment metagenome TaxID=412755 RepID=X1KEP5_9ZZZZ
MTRNEGFDLLKQNVQNQNLIKHCLAVEAIMRTLARHFEEGEEDKSSSSPFAIAREDEERWGLTGLLHDIDYETTKDNPSQHSLVGAKMLEDLGIDKEYFAGSESS